MPEIPPSMAMQNALSRRADADSPGWGMGLAAASLAFVTVISVYLLLRPPLYNYDGYSYRLEALQPADGANINPHHLLWYPAQRGIAAITSAFGTPSPEAFQVFGILILSITLAWLCLLLVRLTGRIVLAYAITIFIAFSPHIWDVGLQNQPYTAVSFCIVGFLWAIAACGASPRLRLIASGMALSSAVMFQQAVAITVPAVAIGFIIAGAGPWQGRLKRAMLWAGAITLGVAAVYAVMARAAAITPSGFIKWTLEYLQDQHSVQVEWPQTAIKCVMGMVDSLVETSWIIHRFDLQEDRAIWPLYGGILVAGGVAVVVLLSRHGVRDRLFHLLRSSVSFTSVLMLVLAWSVFVFLWEPTGHFWGVNLFPIAFLATWWVRESGKRTAFVLAGVLILVSIWNIDANHRQDQAFSVNYPPPLLQQIRAELGPHDVFIVAGRDWYANRDYSLLLDCLDDWPRNPAMALLDDYVMKGSREQWQQKLDLDIQAAFAAGGRVYVADHVFWPDSYADLEQTTDPFSAYAHMEYAGLGGKTLTGEITRFFNHYQRIQSDFKIGSDPFWELKRKQ